MRLIHPLWSQTASQTGRIASSQPNVQALPVRCLAVAVDAAGDCSTGEPVNIRACLTAQRGHVLLCADYSQIGAQAYASAFARIHC